MKGVTPDGNLDLHKKIYIYLALFSQLKNMYMFKIKVIPLYCWIYMYMGTVHDNTNTKDEEIKWPFARLPYFIEIIQHQLQVDCDKQSTF